MSSETENSVGPVLNPPTAPPDAPSGMAPGRSHWLWLDALVLAAYAVAVIAVARRHEPWSDEAQAWLMARDLGFFRMLFGELRYEGHPGLWHSILWVAIHAFHATYPAMRAIASAAAIGGVAVLIFGSPFWRPVRYLAAFSYFFIYQYAVVARSYTLLPLFAFLAAYFYRRGARGIVGFFCSVIFLSFVSLHGVVLSFALLVGFLSTFWNKRQELTGGERKRIQIGVFAYCAALALIAVMLWPPKDLYVAAFETERSGVAGHLRKAISSLPGGVPTPPVLGTGAIILLQFVGLGGFIGGSQVISLLALVLFGIWCYRRHKFLLYLAAVGGTILFYGFVYGAPHHEGITTLALITVLWVAAPSPQESQSFDRRKRLTYWTAMAVLCYALFVQVRWGASSLANDFKLPYSGAPDAAQFLKSVGGEQWVFAYGTDWGAIEPYFESNIFSNYRLPDGGAYFHHSAQFKKSLDPPDIAELSHTHPDIVVVSVSSEPDTAANSKLVHDLAGDGYYLAHVSPGEMFFRDTRIGNSAYLIFLRRH